MPLRWKRSCAQSKIRSRGFPALEICTSGSALDFSLFMVLDEPVTDRYQIAIPTGTITRLQSQTAAGLIAGCSRKECGHGVSKRRDDRRPSGGLAHSEGHARRPRGTPSVENFA